MRRKKCDHHHPHNKKRRKEKVVKSVNEENTIEIADEKRNKKCSVEQTLVEGGKKLKKINSLLH